MKARRLVGGSGSDSQRSPNSDRPDVAKVSRNVARVLIIEDETNLRFTVARALRAAGHEVVEAAAMPEANEHLDRSSFDAVLTDVNLGPDNGIDLVAKLREDGFEGVIVVMTGYGTVESAVRAMKVGADDYLEKPVRLDELTILMTRLLDARADRKRLRLYKRLERAGGEASVIIGQSPAWLQTLSLAERMAQAPVPTRIDPSAGAALPTILLLGETGVGKGVLARHIHEAALRARDLSDAPFVHVNCSAFPATLIESELFGHEKGAFTDARSAREGLFEMADGGTIFLDEIGDMPLELQGKLLTVLERGIIRRIGGTREIPVRVRVIAATNQDLEKRAVSGTFRRDLLYRLNALTIRIPPLRDRGEDATLIAQASLERMLREYSRPMARLSPDAIIAIKAHDWPGNVRELVNAMQRVAMLCDREDVGAHDLGIVENAERQDPRDPDVLAHDDRTSSSGLSFDFDGGRCTFTDVERELMKQSLTKTRGNVSRAAKLIGMQRSSFRYRIERYGLESFVREVSQ